METVNEIYERSLEEFKESDPYHTWKSLRTCLLTIIWDEIDKHPQWGLDNADGIQIVELLKNELGEFVTVNLDGAQRMTALLLAVGSLAGTLKTSEAIEDYLSDPEAEAGDE